MCPPLKSGITFRKFYDHDVPKNKMRGNENDLRCVKENVRVWKTTQKASKELWKALLVWKYELSITPSYIQQSTSSSNCYHQKEKK